MIANIEQFFTHIIEHREDKRWVPNFHAPEDVAAAYPVVAGYPVIVDIYCDPKSIEMRAETGKLLARLTGLHLPKK